MVSAPSGTGRDGVRAGDLVRRLFLLGPSVFAALAALHLARRWPLWSGELFTWAAATRGWSGLLQVVADDRHPPLSFALARISLAVFGDSDLALRLPSVLAAVVTVGLVTATGARWWGTRTGLLAGWLVALSPLLLVQASDARPYAMVAAVGAAQLWGALAISRDPSPRRGFVVLGLATALGLYVHYIVVVSTAAVLLAVALGVEHQRRRRWGGAVVAVGVAVLLFLPWALGPLRSQLGASAQTTRSVAVLWHLLFPVFRYRPLATTALTLVAWVGVDRALRRRELDLVGLAIGLVVAPWFMSSWVDVARRGYVFVGLLPMVCLLAATALHRLFARPLHLGLAALMLLSALAVPVSVVLRLPSSPTYAIFAQGFDGGVYDARLDAQVLASAAPSGRRVWVGHDLPSDRFARYAPELFVSGPEPGPDDWIASPVKGPDATAEAFVYAFSFKLTVPDPTEATAVTKALSGHRHAPYLEELAARQADLDLAADAADLSLLSLEPALLHARLALESGRPDRVRMGWGDLLTALRADDAMGAATLLTLREQAWTALGEPARAAQSGRSASCLRAHSSVPTWGLCLWSGSRAYMTLREGGR